MNPIRTIWRRLRSILASVNFFKVWNVPPLLGRTFAPDQAVPLDKDYVPAKDTVAVLSYSMWQKLFGGDRGVVGKTLELSARHFTVVGVMPAWFQPQGAFPICWLPVEPAHPHPDLIIGPNTQLIARLRPETSQAQAKAMLDTIAGRLKKDYPSNVRFGYGRDWSKRPHELGLWIRPPSAGFQDSHASEDLRRTLFGLLAAIVFVLLIVCANVANLTLARAERAPGRFGNRRHSELGSSALR
jgi:hypothetical protein